MSGFVGFHLQTKTWAECQRECEKNEEATHLCVVAETIAYCPAVDRPLMRRGHGFGHGG
jgi:hypothetical protein